MNTPDTVESASRPVPARELSYRLEQEKAAQPDLEPPKKQATFATSPLSQTTTLAGPQLTRTKTIPSLKTWQIYFTQEVAFDWFLSAQMYVLTFGTGLLDVTTYNAFNVFATKMTGNLLLLSIDGIDGSRIHAALSQNAATAIGSFILGAVAFGHIGRLIGRRRRFYLLITNVFQTLLILGACAIQFWGPMEEIGTLAIIKMFLLAFAMAGQVSLAIGVGLAELNTTMITAALIQLCYDPRIFKPNNSPRTRRLAFVLTMVLGHFVGAAASKNSIVLGILLTAIVKGMVTLSFLANPGLVPCPGDEESGDSRASGAVTPAVQVLWGD